MSDQHARPSSSSRPLPPSVPEIHNSTALRCRSNSLGELFKRVRDANVDGGDGDSRDHHALDVINYTTDQRPPPRSSPFLLTFRDLCYSVKTSKKHAEHQHRDDQPAEGGVSATAEKKRTRTKTLLDSISGEAREGEILAVLGASGSGKSTLIDALANRIARGSLHGTITLNEETVDGRMMKAISAYVMQDDLLFPMLTVEETLMYSSEFRLPSSLSHKKKKERVQTLIDQLGLRSAAKTIIGDEIHRGVSGGERRRVSIGIDIIHDPILLFLDEPTSGLDSTSAFMVVKVLRRIAESGSVVVMSIHQPSSRILQLLDRLILLSRGQMVYSGSPAQLRPFFHDFGRPISDNENRTEFALDLIRELESSPDGTIALIGFNKSWQQPKDRVTNAGAGGSTTNRPLSLKEAVVSRGKQVSQAATDMPEFANSFWTEMIVLSKRSFTNAWRLPELFAVRLGAVLVTGFILATIFWRLDESPKGVQERIGFFAFAMSTTFYTCAEALPVFLQEREIFMRETAYNAYRRSSYVLSNAVVALPSLVILSAAFAGTTFFSVGLAGGTLGFLFYSAITLASFWAGSSFVTFLSGVVKHVVLGYTVVVAILAYFLLFSGFFISRNRIPIYWLWFHYISLVKYPYEGVLHNEFGDPRRCFVRGAQIFDGSPLGMVPETTKEGLLQAMSRTLGMNITATTCVTTGPDVLRQQGVMQLSKWTSLGITVAWGFLFRFLFYLSLLFGCRNKRR